MIRVRVPSRLHFGLLSLTDQPEAESAVPPRRFGGVGLMVEAPGLVLTAEPTDRWSAQGPLAERALAAAQRAAPDRPHRLVVERGAPEHAGLGTGTQVALAAGHAVAPTIGVMELAQRVGRGQRSAVGIHGFAGGGFLVEGGQGTRGGIGPLLARVDFPAAWPIVLFLPPWDPGLTGLAERDAFDRLAQRPQASRRVEILCLLVLQGLLPALFEQDHATFGEALHEFNRRAGEAFAPIQGGCYASPCVDKLIRYVRSLGAPAVGQSSWGPAVFAVARDADQAAWLVRRVSGEAGLAEVEALVSAASNRGARVEHIPAVSGDEG